MSDAERQSPRTAICNWLQSTDSKSTARPADAFPEQQSIEQRSRHHSRRQRTTRYPSETRDQRDKKPGRKHQRHQASRSQQGRVPDQVLLVNAHEAQPQRENPAVNSNRPGLAERLGLHAPFRTLKDHSNNDTIDFQGHPRKRRRSRSSTSSYLEPAAANDFSDNGRDRPSHATRSRTASSGPALRDRDKDTSPTTSHGSKTMLQSPEKLLKSYARRPRHKTRQDRYELKDNNRDSEKTKRTAKRQRGGKKQKKHKRKEKSGAALMHDFTAQNVAHDRLTMKPAQTLGLFGKGRASSPVRRRGLPDLAFTEMTFLASRREKPKDSLEDSFNRLSNQKKRRKSTKATDTEAEISRYFTSAKPTSLEVTSSYGQKRQQDRRRSRDHESPQACIDLPDRPFLGFGSCGPNTSISPAKLPLNKSPKSLRLRDSPSLTRSTSYLTWSQSGAPSYAPTPDRRPRVEPLASSKLSNRKCTSPAPHRRQHSVPPVFPSCVQTTSSGTQHAASRPSPRHEIANQAPGQSSESRLATSERLGSREKIQVHGDTGTVQLDAARVSQGTEDSVPDTANPAEAATHDGSNSALQLRNEAACQSSGCEPRYEPQAHDVPPLSDQKPINSPHKDQLDDILEALLRECNTVSDLDSRATSIHGNLHVSEEARIPDRAQHYSPVSARALVNNVYALERPASALKSTSKPRSASLQQPSAHDGARSTLTPSSGGLNSFNRPSSGYTRGHITIPTQIQLDSLNAWNFYESMYEGQQEQVDLRPEASRELRQPYTAVRADDTILSGETDHAASSNEYTKDIFPMEERDEVHDDRLHSYETLQEEDEDGNHEGIGHGEWDDEFGDRFIDHGASYNSEGPIFDEPQEGWNHGFNGHQQRVENVDRERSLALRANHQLFTTNMPGTYSSRRPDHTSNMKHGFEGFANAQVHALDPPLSDFWTPHKLY